MPGSDGGTVGSPSIGIIPPSDATVAAVGAASAAVCSVADAVFVPMTLPILDRALAPAGVGAIDPGRLGPASSGSDAGIVNAPPMSSRNTIGTAAAGTPDSPEADAGVSDVVTVAAAAVATGSVPDDDDDDAEGASPSAGGALAGVAADPGATVLAAESAGATLGEAVAAA